MKSFKLLGVSVLALTLVACESSEEKAVKFAENAQEYLEEGEVGRARLQFENALQNDPNNIVALRGAARIAEQEERFADQLRYLQRLLNNVPGDVEALSKLARLNLLAGEPDEAMRRADQALEKEPSNVEALTVKGAAQVLQNNLEGASETLEQALAQAPDNAEIRNLLAARYVRDEEFSRAQEILDEGLATDPGNEPLLVVKLLLAQRQQDLGMMEETFAALVEANPENGFYRERFADFLLAQQRFEDAEAQYRAALPLLEERTRAVGRVVGIVREQEGEEAAEAELREIVASYEDDGQLRFAVPSFLCQIGEIERCEAELERLASAEESSEEVRATANVQLAERAFARREIGEARELVEAVLEEDDTDPDALTVLGKIQLAEEDVETAIETLRSALAAEPDKEQALILLGLAYEANDRGNFAEAQLAQAIDRIGLSEPLFNAYRGVLLRNGRTEQAAELTLRYSQGPDATPQTRREGAAVLLSQNRPEEAEVMTRSLLRSNAEDDAARRILATSLLQQDRYEEALGVIDEREMEVDASLMRIRSEALTRLDRNDELRSYLEEIAGEGEQADAYALLTQLEVNQEDLAAAEEAARRGVEAFPSEEALYLNLYNVQQSRERNEEAMATLDRGIENANNSAGLRLLKSNALLQSGDRQEALVLLRSLREDNALNDVAANNLAALLLDSEDDPAEALEIAKRFEDSEQPFFIDTLAWAYYRTGDLENAERFSARAEANARPNAEVLYHRGVIAAANGDTETARDALTRALEAPGKTDTVNDEAINEALAELD
jgi:tetratricopeptide (TPR) repeat protein